MCLVVCLPRPSFSLISAVEISKRLSIAFKRLDLPTPEFPQKTDSLSLNKGYNCSTPSLFVALTTKTLQPLFL